jgi:hypothetical protein
VDWPGVTFVDVDTPPKKEPEPVAAAALREPRCIVTQHLIYIRRPNPGPYQPPFGTHPDDFGSLADCRARAKELSNELNLSVIEINEINPDLKSNAFASPGIYICCEQYDQFHDKHHRVFRY